MQIDFLKCHGSGNDFPLIDARDLALSEDEWARVAVALADRGGSVGGDGLLLLTAGDATHEFGMRMFNSDGSEAETCLNGLRCVARAGFEALGIDEARVRLKTSDAHVSRDPDLAAGVVTIREVAGPVDLDVSHWPMHIGVERIVEAPIAPLGSERVFTAVAIPNPHLVCFVETIDEAELVALGTQCEAAPDWLPNRANVSFVEVRGANLLFVRTFERGVGLTDSCGSAMAASTYAACLTRRCGFGTEITVHNRGGLVRAEAREDGMVRLSGNATVEWRGSVDIHLATRTAGPVTVTTRHDEEVAAWRGVVDAIV
ncbi:diaminopimelate epimerase [Sphingomonas sp. 10B4]|uniref:diaminopimelate epimerase n=1 Tax=Sphingomonas sp. 10B4 TaxID=3048575 RepID=UPI002AB5372B|nr:diaminopimelate epimerase [Sphingomonas sp. 10B4]MDY7523549.1 diaminopimelate epimerase [Sphingomonas sp. 10B4]MEB0284062.1 diaminopimelate epimerase [Sphingomonas sp. 10B4]